MVVGVERIPVILLWCLCCVVFGVSPVVEGTVKCDGAGSMDAEILLFSADPSHPYLTS